MLLEALKSLELPDLPDEAVAGMEEAIEKLSPADVVGLLATVPLVPQAQEMMRMLAYRDSRTAHSRALRQHRQRQVRRQLD